MATVCAIDECVALPVDGTALCAVHVQYTVRSDGAAAVHCYACGKLIRIGARWVVRAEGAFHARVSCLSRTPEQFETW